MLLTKAIEGFNIARLADGYAPVTLSGYRSSLGTLAEFLGNPEVEKITPENPTRISRNQRGKVAQKDGAKGTLHKSKT
ncbi:MAG: hypothetical protein PHQ40_15820 [Anaerolineaceae bacterium]|nr:hypothetical protein [Anaerolineaceae bacterium]